MVVTPPGYTLGMKAKRVVRSGDTISPAIDRQAKTDEILAEISRLYRDRFRAHYNKDLSAFRSITQQIDDLRAQLSLL